MKAITLWNPWALLMAMGEKRIETRSWPTNYRGELAIHCAKNSPDWARKLSVSDPAFIATFKDYFDNEDDLLFTLDKMAGHVVCTVNLIDCVSVQRVDFVKEEVCERKFGDYSPGRYAWITRDVKRIYPIQTRGAQGLWDLKQAPTPYLQDSSIGRTIMESLLLPGRI